MNDWRRLRFEFIMCYHHHTPIFESRVVKVLVQGPYISHQDGVCLDYDSRISQHLNLSNLSSLVWWIVRHSWDWYMGAEMVTTIYFPALRGYKFCFAHTYFSHPDCVCTDWFRQFTASQPFQCIIISIMNGWRRWRLEFILHNLHHTPAFESQVVKILAEFPTFQTKIECVQTDSAISQHLNPSYLSL